MVQIKRIDGRDTWPIRHQVMWPDKPLAYIKLPEDARGLHFGLFVQEHLVSVVSLFVSGKTAQFRKFATLETEQGKGYGSQLLQGVFQVAKEQGVERIWCNARASKVAFYSRFGLQATEKTFTKGGIKYVILNAPL
ncbi:MAG TPA: GNAT family N-acetyltransferase [Saprospiraceae bacterium]|nr:GNAT family N-acetyltransferase [Saprospiraceae bacterium]